MPALPLIALLSIGLVTACPSDPLCLKCSGTRCLYCSLSFPDSSTGKCVIPSTPIENCLIYVANGQCRLCNNGFFVSQNGWCEKIPLADCAGVSANGECAFCDHSRLMENGKCEGSSKRCSDENCLNCVSRSDGRERCFICKNGFELGVESTGELCQKSDGGCLVRKNGVCELCRFGSYDSGKGTCISNPEKIVSINGEEVLTVILAVLIGLLEL